MQITDPIADLLTRIRNASTAKHPSVEIPASNMKKYPQSFSFFSDTYPIALLFPLSSV